MFFSPAHVLSEEHAQVFWKSSPHSVAGLYIPGKSISITQLQKKRMLLDYTAK